MTKLEQAARQALEALEELFHSNSTKVAVEKYNTAHNALREALSEQAEQEPVVFYRCNGCGHAYESIAPSSCDCMEAKDFSRIEYYASPVQQVDLLDALNRILEEPKK